MSLDNIQLPGIVLQNLYNKSLFDLKAANAEPALDDLATISYLGSNQKKIAIILISPDAIYLPDDDLNFLLGILSACKLSMADIALVNLSMHSSISYKEVAQQLFAEKVFLFGVGPEVLGLPLQFPHYQVQQYNNQVYLSSVPLTELQNDKAEKTKLWNCLKKIFSL
ncbi:MAG TPA: hypothetical protein VK498_03075 [Ferruginibacter sp.]|nr:hypothetical protein [Ferruginibacter sp.]